MTSEEEVTRRGRARVFDIISLGTQYDFLSCFFDYVLVTMIALNLVRALLEQTSNRLVSYEAQNHNENQEVQDLCNQCCVKFYQFTLTSNLSYFREEE